MAVDNAEINPKFTLAHVMRYIFIPLNVVVVVWLACSPSTPTIRVRIPLTSTVFSVKFVFKKNEDEQKTAKTFCTKHITVNVPLNNCPILVALSNEKKNRSWA